jgi:hypothetical protein
MMNETIMYLHPNGLAEASYRQAAYFQERSQLEVPLRKFACFAAIFAFSLLTTFASAQQGDAMFGFGTLMSSGSYSSSSSTFSPFEEKGGLYPNISADVIFHRRIGAAFNVSWRGSQGNYQNGYEAFRPILYDFDAMYEPRIGKKIGLDLQAGIGAASTRFYQNAIVSCSYFSGCINYTTSSHFMTHLGGGVRYYVWGHAFVRPEINYYYVRNNYEFDTGNLFRVGASIGYTIGGPE